jgi:hypothetical protein
MEEAEESEGPREKRSPPPSCWWFLVDDNMELFTKSGGFACGMKGLRGGVEEEEADLDLDLECPAVC